MKDLKSVLVTMVLDYVKSMEPYTRILLLLELAKFKLIEDHVDEADQKFALLNKSLARIEEIISNSEQVIKS